MNLDISQKEFLRSELGRKWIIEKVLKCNIKENFQKNETSYELCKKITDIDIYEKEILVLFNLEILEILIHYKKVSSSKITFISDCEIEKEIAKKIYKIKNLEISKDFKILKIIGEKYKMQKKVFDLCFSNPPYGKQDQIYLKIFELFLSISDELIFVTPSTWLLSLKQTKQYEDLRNLVKDRSYSYEFFNGNPIFGIKLFLPCVISYIKEKRKDNIKVKYFDDRFEVSDIYDITKFGSFWIPIVKPFLNRIINITKTTTSLWNNEIFWQKPNYNPTGKIDKNKFYCQIAAIRGNVNTETDGKNITQDDFYTLVMKNIKENYGIRREYVKEDSKKMLTFEFTTEIERNNFLEYCKTDFVRFCLSILKNGSSTYAGETTLIPWMDFKQSWTDEKLYKLFNIDKKTQEYIESFLPDYYNLRKKNETT